MEPDALAIVATLALLVQCGHTLHAVGAARARSVAAVAVRSLLGAATAVLVTYLAGVLLIEWYSIDLGPAGQGSQRFQSARIVQGPAVFFASPGAFLSVLAIALLPSSVLTAATAERARVRGVLIASCLLTAIALPLLTAAGWVLLSRLDQPRADATYASSASLSGVSRIWPAIVSHLLAAAGGLTLATVLGPRSGKYNRDGSANSIPAHSVPTMVGGDLLLFIGLPMLAAALAGDPAARVVNALLAASAAALAAMAACSLRDRHVEVMGPWSAAIGGLVVGSLSSPEHPLMSIALGAVGGFVLPHLSLKIDLKLRVDDPSGLCLAHLVGGLLGLLGATLGAVLEGRTHIGSVLLLASIGVSGGVTVICVAAAFTLLIALALRRARWLRIDEATESEGLDLAQHDINAYPDFQQTMIKSYHLRQ